MGFFTRDTARRSGKARALPLETVRQLGYSAVQNMNPGARHPNIQPQLPDGACDILVLDGWPTGDDDARGQHLQGNVGQRYRRRIARLARGLGVGFDYVCRTLPKDDREPTPVELAGFRKDVEQTIAKAKPRAIIALGHRATDWLSPGIGYGIPVHRGRAFPVEVAGHRTWAFPVIGRHNWTLCEKGDDRASGEEYREQTWRDIGNACQLREPPVLMPSDKSELLRRYGTHVELMPSSRAVDNYAGVAGSIVSIDIETHGTRPYQEGARILSVALSDGQQTLAMPVDHPEVPVTPKRVSSVLDALLRLFGGRTMVAHNASFELEWLQHFTKRWAANSALGWFCTDVGGFVLDERPGRSLDYLARMYFGLPLKSISPARLWDQKHALRPLLEYNALDAAVGFDVMQSQAVELQERGLMEACDYHLDRLVPVVDMQARGLPISVDHVREFKTSYTRQVASLHQQVLATPEVVEYEQRRGLFNPDSNDDVVALFVDQLQAESCVRDGKRTVDAAALEQVDPRHQSAALILQHRGVSKKLSTYIERYLPESPKTYLMADGLVHCEYATTRAQTRRLACEGPNNQNWPKRKGAEIRGVVRSSDEGWVIVSIDLGQIEARVLGMLTKDAQVVRMFTEDYDVHLEWAKKLVGFDPGIMDRRGLDDIRKWRGHVKNQFVFPSYYGAGARKIAGLTQIPEPIIKKALDAFWKQFAAVKRWQKDQLSFYEQHHYVESPTGFRRRAPLKYNMIINTPIQSVASDICIQGLINCNRIAYERNLPWWTPIMNIHDDLTFMIPESELASFVPEAVRAMIDLGGDPAYDFINVPLTCEVEVGRDWASMEEYGTYRSDRL